MEVRPRKALRVAVVGGGISGLSTAYRLHKSGCDATLFEASNNTGGKIGSTRTDGLDLDLGPVTISETPQLRELARELGLEVLYASNATSVRYIYSKGKLNLVGPNMLTSSLLSFRGKLSLLKAPFSAKAKSHESVADYARRRFGKEVYQRLLNPMMNGIYAGNSELLSATAVLKKRGPRKIISLKGGVKSLTDALTLRLGEAVRTKSAINDLNELNDFDEIYLTTPAFVTGNLVRDLNWDLSSSLSKIHYSSLSQVYCEVDETATFDGFGFLVPSEERMSLLGAVCVSNVFPLKAREGRKLFVLFVGGDRPYPFTAGVDGAVNEFNKILRPSLTDILYVQEWNNAIPQFYVGHERLVDQIGQFENQNPRIKIRGNYISGVAVGDCIYL